MKTFFSLKKILKAAGHVSENDVFLFRFCDWQKKITSNFFTQSEEN